MLSSSGKTWADVCRGVKDSSTQDFIADFGNGGSKKVEELPLDVIWDILSRLPVDSLTRFRSVCKSWDILTHESKFLDLQLHRASTRQCYCFIVINPVYSSFSEIDCSLLYKEKGIWKTRKISVDIPVKSNLNINTVGSCNDMLFLLCNDMLFLLSESGVILWNPITRERVLLPKSEHDFETVSNSETNSDSGNGSYVKTYWSKISDIGVGFDVVAKKYKVVRIYNYIGYDDLIQKTIGEIITLGEKSWRALRVPYKISINDSSPAGPVFLDGAFHWMIDTSFCDSDLNHILAFDISDEQFRTISVPPSMQVRPRYHRNPPCLFKLGQTLAIVDVSDSKMCIWKIEGRKSTKGYWISQCIYKPVCNTH